MCMSVRITLTPPICTGGGMEYTPVSGAGACKGMRVRASLCAPYLVIISLLICRYVSKRPDDHRRNADIPGMKKVRKQLGKLHFFLMDGRCNSPEML